MKAEIIQIFDKNNLTLHRFSNDFFSQINTIQNDIKNISSSEGAKEVYNRSVTLTNNYLTAISNLNSTMKNFLDQVRIVEIFTKTMNNETSWKINGDKPLHPLLDGDNTDKLDMLYSRKVERLSPEEQIMNFYTFKMMY